MDWKDIVGPALQQAAPLAARLLLGQIPIVGPILAQLGGSAVESEVGKILGNQLGVDPTPEAVNAAITGQPTDLVIAKLQAADAEAAAKWPALAEAYKAAAQAETEQARVAADDTASARARDLQVRQAPGADGAPAGTNTRANVMLIGAFASLIITVTLLALFRTSIPDGIAAIMGGLCGSLGTMLTQAFNFEFGSSRGSSVKTDQIMGMLTTQK